ncbi:hypothetical protein SDC9_203653 [bioreactor metagenome]|uniref:Uncharacterized protein n=1 Tax=bioreactor metagenome TaxID=1076179 RepID=A0A645IZS2_9ZZZZ
MDGNPVCVHSKSHLDDGIGAILFGSDVFAKFIRLIYLEIEICYIIIDGLCIATVFLSDLHM